MNTRKQNIFVQELVHLAFDGQTLGSVLDQVRNARVKYGERTVLLYDKGREAYLVQYYREENDIEHAQRLNAWSERETAMRALAYAQLNTLKQKYPEHKLGDII